MSDAFCTQCLKAGHRCAAIVIEREPGDAVLCAFCEDGIACPVRKREVDPAFRDRQRRPMLIGESGPKSRARAPRQPKPRPLTVTVHADRPQEFIRSTAGQQLIAAAAKESTTMSEPVTKHKRTSTRTCSCGCGATIFGRWPYRKGHNREGGAVTALPRKARRGRPPKASARAAAPTPPHNPLASPGAATLSLSERQLVKLFVGWPLPDKVACVQAWLDRADVDGAL